MSEEDTVFRLEAFFSGHVQGVGFRYSTAQLAKGFDVTGFVRNLVDGRVELLAEGERTECQQFLETLEDELDNYIRKTERSESQGPRTHKSFSIA